MTLNLSSDSSSNEDDLNLNWEEQKEKLKKTFDLKKDIAKSKIKRKAERIARRRKRRQQLFNKTKEVFVFCYKELFICIVISYSFNRMSSKIDAINNRVNKQGETIQEIVGYLNASSSSNLYAKYNQPESKTWKQLLLDKVKNIDWATYGTMAVLIISRQQIVKRANLADQALQDSQMANKEQAVTIDTYRSNINSLNTDRKSSLIIYLAVEISVSTDID